MLKICGRCDQLYPRPQHGDDGHCAACSTIRAASRPTTTQRGLGSKWATAARDQIRAEPWCARCGSTTDLTADHLVARALGGTIADGLQTLCRTCNSRKGSRPHGRAQ